MGMYVGFKGIVAGSYLDADGSVVDGAYRTVDDSFLLVDLCLFEDLLNRADSESENSIVRFLGMTVDEILAPVEGLF